LITGGCISAAFFLTEVMMKQFLIVRVTEGLNQMVDLITLPGLYTLEAAQSFVQQALQSEPGLRLLIQEVGTA